LRLQGQLENERKAAAAAAVEAANQRDVLERRLLEEQAKTMKAQADADRLRASLVSH